MPDAPHVRGLGRNRAQVTHLLAQVLLVGLTLGLMRTVVPALAEDEFGIPRGAFVLLGTFVLAFGLVKAALNFVAGQWSERVGRFWPNVLGMSLCGAGVVLIPFGAGPWGWAGAAALAGLGMALLYPNLSASVADITPPAWRGAAIGVYRFWRDLGYATGALVVGLSAWALGPEGAFWTVGAAMLASGGLLWLWGDETHPGLNPAP